jgi:hypothetical protein
MLTLAALAIVIVLILCWGMGNCWKSERMTPTYNARFEDSLLDKSTDYFYDKKGLTAADTTLSDKLLSNQGVF